MLKPWILIVTDARAVLVVSAHFTLDEARQAFVDLAAGGELSEPYGEIWVIRNGELTLEETTHPQTPKE